ncbi:MAG: hypothetical protein ACI83W_000679 [Marinoscillum sp.]|jgi:hypothetical protein
MKSILLTLTILVGLTARVYAQRLTTGDVNPNDVNIKAFKLSNDQKVNVKGSGGIFHDESRLLFYYGWILDSETREVVWHLFDEVKDRDFKRTDGFFDFNFEVPLKAGTYELYWTGAYKNKSWTNNWTVSTLDDVINDVFDSRNKEKFRKTIQEELKISLEATGLSEVNVETVLGKKLKSAKLYFVKAENDEKYEEGFNLTAPTDIDLYAIGEGQKQELYDYVWIQDMVTNERVFKMDYRNTSFAGGAEKNLKLKERITLPKGSYKLIYRTDDSHSFEKWNSLPPDDPMFWGVTLTPSSAADEKNFAAYNPPKTIAPLVEIAKVRNNKLESIGFSVEKSMDVRLLCIGEGDDDDDEMADYGWIVNAKTRDVVWKMKGYRSESAGGANKNRKYEGVINLEKGDYIAYYATDGSHSYENWNANEPDEPELWGLSIYATKESDINAIKIFNSESYLAKNVIMEIVMLGDDAYEKREFTLDKATTVTVMALGEGSDGRMHDFGWIKDVKSGRTVWEMDYYGTENAGGASKNRMVTTSLKLEAGQYRVYFETDGSHSFRGWNADAPNDPQSYGIRILKAE